MNFIKKLDRNLLRDAVLTIRRIIIGSYRTMLALFLVLISLPIWWLVDYDKLTKFVLKHGAMFGVLLSWIAAGLLWWNFHPIRAFGVIMLAMLLAIIEKPKAFFE